LKKSVSLKVLETYSRDFGRGVARIDYDTMDLLDASTGDIIEIKGKRKTVAKCLPLYPSDERKGMIRMDGLVRNNAEAFLEDTITVRKIKAVPAEKVVVDPIEAIPPIDERYLADALESVPLIKGDNVMVPYFGRRLTFQVIGVTPAADTVVVTQKTVFQITEKGETLRETLQLPHKDIEELTDELERISILVATAIRNSNPKRIGGPKRIDILRILKSKGPLIYPELKSLSGFNSKKESGKFAYHLRKLLREKLVALNKSERRYKITNLGWLVLNLAEETMSID